MSMTTVAEMTPEALKSLVFKTVQKALGEAMGGPDWQIEWRGLMAHQRHLASLYAEFADEDRSLAEAGVTDYAGLLLQEDSAR